jgi:flagellar capping protein FliD
VTAWDTIGTKISALRTALEALDTASDLKTFKATSSNTNVLTVSAGSSAVPGPITMVVKELATAQQLMSKSFTSAGAEINPLATVDKTLGSAPRGVGAKMAVSSGGSMAGSVSGGCIEGAVFDACQEALKSGQARLLHFGVADDDAWDVGLACGGVIDVFVEPLDW